MRKMPKTAEREPERLPPPISKMLRVDELKDGEERSIEINRAERALGESCARPRWDGAHL